ncbi:11815_t:CDS:2 [Acaulospora morrowiae]|uniref:26S proteasome complex subunit SEM1 n=1 Tax=Acaulospora morrowiae TaxID=94023 RepID=A0A9N9D758_9GLOM|nr:11815_t:CDS:2 [Acaulospora morrowiae]
MSSNNPGSSSNTKQADNNTEESQLSQEENAQQQKVSIPHLGALEEDDEFEEFAAEDWNETEEDQETHLWEDNWDDEDVEDDFSKQLRAEITKTTAPQPMRL